MTIVFGRHLFETRGILSIFLMF